MATATSSTDFISDHNVSPRVSSKLFMSLYKQFRKTYDGQILSEKEFVFAERLRRTRDPSEEKRLRKRMDKLMTVDEMTGK